jgi:hypothetical protein
VLEINFQRISRSSRRMSVLLTAVGRDFLRVLLQGSFKSEVDGRDTTGAPRDSDVYPVIILSFVFASHRCRADREPSS